jgi:hypothetical protein
MDRNALFYEHYSFIHILLFIHLFIHSYIHSFIYSHVFKYETSVLTFRDERQDICYVGKRVVSINMVLTIFSMCYNNINGSTESASTLRDTGGQSENIKAFLYELIILLIILCKGKFHTLTCHEGRKGEVEV